MLNVPLGVDGGVDDVAAPAEATAVDPAVGANSRSAMYRSPHLPAPAQLRQRRRADQEPGDEPRAGPPVPRNLNSGMDASSAARNLREHFSEKLGQTWEEHRRVVLSEMSLSGALFASTLCYECLPTVLAGLLCNLIEGPIATKNRGLVSMHGTTPSQIPGKLLSLLASDLTFTTQSATIALIIYVSMYRDHLTASAPFEVFGMIFLTMVAKAFIIAFKYAFKSDLLTSRTEDICLHTEKYEQTKQRDRGQMVCYVLNFVGGDLQKDELISLLYKSSLIANTDLSCTSFSWHPIAEQLARAQGRWGSARSPSELDSVQAPTGARSQGTAGGEGHQNVAQQLWDVMLEITKTVDAAEVFDQTDTDKSGDITLAEMQVRAKAAAGDRYDEEEVRREFEALDVDGNQRLSADELAKRHVKTSRLLMFGAKVIPQETLQCEIQIRAWRYWGMCTARVLGARIATLPRAWIDAVACATVPCVRRMVYWASCSGRMSRRCVRGWRQASCRRQCWPRSSCSSAPSYPPRSVASISGVYFSPLRR